MTRSLTTRRLDQRLLGTGFNPVDLAAFDAVWASDPEWSHPADGGSVSTWRNMFGGGDLGLVSGAGNPTYRAATAAFGGRPTVEFPGTRTMGYNSDNHNQPYTYMAVAQSTSGADGTSQTIVSGWEQAGRGVGKNTSNQWRYWFFDGSGSPESGGSVDADPHVFTAVGNGASSEMWVDGVLVASGSAGTQNSFWFFIGGNNVSGHYLTGHVGFAAQYNGGRSGDIVHIERQLARYYSIPYFG